MTIRTRLVGLMATLLLLAVLVGLPATLLALGANPIPTSFPNLEQIRTAFTTPDDGTVALAAIKVIAWGAWLFLAGSILLELGARARGVHAPTLPGLGIPQVAARQLVGAAALLFVVLPTAPTLAGASPVHVASVALVVTAPTAGPVTSADIPPPVAPATGSARTYLVRAGDSLAGIARRALGNEQRWPELAALNPQVAAHPNLIHPGTVLDLPAPPPARDQHINTEHTHTEHSYTVKAGDTLSRIAQRELGDARLYPAIFEASTSTPQAGGTHLSDPDRIDIGQILTIPGTPPAEAANPPATNPPPGTPSPPPPHRPDRTGRPEQDPSQGQRAAPSDPGTPVTPASVVPYGAAHSTAGASGSIEAGGQVTPAPWMLAGLTGGGALLAGSILMMLRRRRRAQLRHRRPGHTLAAPQPVLSPVEKTITSVGALTAPTVDHLDLVLRRLAAAAALNGSVMPELAAVELTATHLVLHLGQPADLPHPWIGTADRHHWMISADTPVDQVGPPVPDQPAPYPLLVTIGLGNDGEVWLLNVEDLNVSITGDPTYGQDFARYLAADVACNPWSAGVDVACLGVAAEVAGLNPDRLHVYDPTGHDADPIADYLGDAVHTIDRSADCGHDVVTARAHQSGADPWPARLLLVDAGAQNPVLDQLLDLVHAHAGHTATSVVVRGHRPQTPGTVLEVTAGGRVLLPVAGLDLIAVGLTSDEAQGCTALLSLADPDPSTDTGATVAVPVDEDAADGWRSFSDEAGALRHEHTGPRNDQDDPDSDAPDTPAPSTSLLGQSDQTYLDVATTTEEDLQTLAPRVSHSVRADVENADPTLDDDVAMWFRDDSALPKLRLLGPVRATTRGRPLTKRKPYMTELLAFIALRRHGATPEEVAETFNITKPKARDYVLTVRHWLGTNPRTGDPHLPDARLAPAAAVRDVPVYQVVDLLIDVDLFRRLRVRGEARGGAVGIEDLRTALRLVEGRPFDYPLEREQGGGWAWLVEGDRLDEHMAVAVVDVAHTVTTHALAEGDMKTARQAAQTAALAAPYEEIPRLDLAAVAAAEGHHAEARRIIRDEVCNRTDDDGAPPELPARTEQILASRKGWTGSKAS